MPIIKPAFDGKAEESSSYSGPPPTPGLYHGVIKGFWYTKIKGGDNAGAGMYKILITVDQGKFKGAGIFHNFQMLKQNAWSTNQFLDSLCKNDTQRGVLRNWFWDIGCDAEATAEKMGHKVNFIGKPKFVPQGKELSFILKNEPDQHGATKAVIDRFVIPIEGEGSVEPEPVVSAPDSPAEPEDAGLSEFDQETTSNPAASTATEEEAPPPEGDDDDDPWS